MCPVYLLGESLASTGRYQSNGWGRRGACNFTLGKVRVVEYRPLVIERLRQRVVTLHAVMFTARYVFARLVGMYSTYCSILCTLWLVPAWIADPCLRINAACVIVLDSPTIGCWLFNFFLGATRALLGTCLSYLEVHS